MTQRDFLLRQIEMMGELLVAIRNLILGRATSSSVIHARLQQASRQGGLDLELAQAATPDTLRMLIAPTGEIEPVRCWLLAETLHLDGLEAELTGERMAEVDERLHGMGDPFGSEAWPHRHADDLDQTPRVDPTGPDPIQNDAFEQSRSV